MPSIDAAAAVHASRHAAGGPDPVTPAGIGAVPADDARLKDTGWRTVAWIPADKFTLTKQTARRIGKRVVFTFQLTPTATGYWSAPAVIPAGMRLPSVQAAVSYPLTDYPSASAPTFVGSMGCNSSGTLVGYVGTLPSSGRVVYGQIEWLSDDAFPTTLPGTPA